MKGSTVVVYLAFLTADCWAGAMVESWAANLAEHSAENSDTLKVKKEETCGYVDDDIAVKINCVENVPTHALAPGKCEASPVGHA